VLAAAAWLNAGPECEVGILTGVPNMSEPDWALADEVNPRAPPTIINEQTVVNRIF
jgi:hypothetical protein